MTLNNWTDKNEAAFEMGQRMGLIPADMRYEPEGRVLAAARSHMSDFLHDTLDGLYALGAMEGHPTEEYKVRWVPGFDVRELAKRP